ncbi:MAG: Actin-like protein ATPase involved in cell morphogenesis [Parcubacteria group bacterium GW2011_GWA2_47_21]|nr:MAG: Actin-like protein ATPase involved in cell morphogenesis [Parcubacteria group bacterium GW2011_GWA2_47_21]
MLRKYLDKFYRLFSHDIGVDLGTANTLVYVRGEGIVINEPSIVAVNQKTGQVVAVGATAKDMLGRTPQHIRAVKPVVEGVISDFEVTEEMMAYLLGSVAKSRNFVFGPRVVVGVPSGITNVEARAVRDVSKNIGAREVHIVEQPMAAAIGIKLPIFEPIGNMVIDIGGGTTDIAIISLGGVVGAKNIKIAGDRFNRDIISYVRSEFKILIGENTAENVKILIGSVTPLPAPLEAVIKGRDLVTGLPRETVITDSDVREALTPSVDILLETVREVLEQLPPEIVADVMQRGIYLTGGGALLKGLPALLEEFVGIAIHVSDDPLTAVARGTGIILEDFPRFKDVLVQGDDELSKI